jgi:bacterioferritin-associated ferredoxin
MSKQTDQEQQPSEILTSEELRQSILAELEASKQDLLEVSDEQLMEAVTGGVDHHAAFVAKAAAVATAVGCCVGTVAGVMAAVAHPEHVSKYAGVGAGVGATAGAAAVGGVQAVFLAKDRLNTWRQQRGAPQTEVELGRVHPIP